MMHSTYAFDIGNTRIKGARFEHGRIAEEYSFLVQDGFPDDFKVTAPSIVSSVASQDLSLSHFSIEPLRFSRQTPIPLKIDYDTPATLGLDRIAGAVGAAAEFPEQRVLLIDMGTCVNYDFISGGVFLGGAISPGFSMRLSAMHDYTARLPNLSATWSEMTSRLPGKSTAECMKTGAFQGLVMEIEGFIGHFKKDSQELTVILTGGDASTFESSIKETIFVRPKIVLQGLNLILEHNVAE